MKNVIIGVALLCFAGLAKAQNGLEQVIVEKYYISDLVDSTGSADAGGGTLPVGSVTYRIYADMLPGYKFQAAYGIPNHELKIQTTTSFFNNEDRGATEPTYTKSQASGNSVMLDSWFSVGAACKLNFGILKADDDGVATVVNSEVPPMLQNANPIAGVPLTVQDGMISGAPESVTFVGFTSNDLDQFDATSQLGGSLSTFNASWACLVGAVGPTNDNRVLIAQMTTDGNFSFELNIQIGTPSGGTESYVALNPDTAAGEIQIPSLVYSSTVGLNEILNPSYLNKISFSVYPNPTANLVTVDFSTLTSKSNGFYQVFDTNGKVVLFSKIGLISNKTQEVIDFTSLPSGSYFVELTIDGVSSARKIVKK